MAEGQNNGNNDPSTTLVLTIAWDQLTGQMSVNGAILNKVVAYGMLDMAKEVIEKFFERQQSTIVVPSGFKVVEPKVVT